VSACLFPFRAPQSGTYLRPCGRVTTFVDRSIQQTVLAPLVIGTVPSRGLARNDVTVF
jgi:hypothetical protein